MPDREQSIAGEIRLVDELSRVELEVCGNAQLAGADISDPGTMDWWAKASINVWADLDGERPHLGVDGVALSRRKDDDEQELVILQADGLRVDLDNVIDVFDALDARSQDYSDFVPAFDVGSVGAELAPKLEEKLGLSLGSEVVILDRVWLAPAWRGLGGVGRLLTARALRWVSSAPRVVLLKPFPIDLEGKQLKDEQVFNPALKNICKVWRSLGFRRFTNDIWFMDPTASPHERAVSRLERRFGLNR